MANSVTLFYSAIASLPTLFVAPSTPPEALALVQEILEEYYFDGIDDIVSAELNQDGDIVGEFTDRVGAREIKRYQYRIGDDVVEYVLLNPKTTAKFSAIYKNPMFGPGSKKGKKKACTKGTPCGDSCQQAGRKCSKKPGSAVKAKIVAAKEALGGEAAKAVTPKTTPGDSGVASATKGGALTLRAIEEEKDAPRFPGDRAKQIDEKYSVEDPSDIQVSKWTQERIRNDFVDTPEAKSMLVAQAIAHELMFGTPGNEGYVRHIKDEESYVKARKSIDDAIHERSGIEINGKTYKNDTEEYWKYQLDTTTKTFGRKNYEKAQKTLSGSKASAAGKQKAQKVVDKYEAELEENKKTAKSHADRVLKRRSDTATFEAEAKADWGKGQKKHAPLIEKLVKGVEQRDSYAMDDAANMLQRRVAPNSFGKSNSTVFKNYLSSKAGLTGKYFAEVKDRKQLKQAFKDFATKYHPDKGGDTKQFQAVAQKYQELLLEYP